MGDTIKVKVVKMRNRSWWYEHLVGKVISVTQAVGYEYDYYFEDEEDSNNAGNILKSDCEVVTTSQTLQERLQQAKAAVEEIEKQLAEEAEKEAEKEASRPFTQAEYEKVVAEFRACKGRTTWEYNESNWYVQTSEGPLRVRYESQITSPAIIRVWFDSYDSAEKAIAKVGAENLKKAWQYEMSIGLDEGE